MCTTATDDSEMPGVMKHGDFEHVFVSRLYSYFLSFFLFLQRRATSSRHLVTPVLSLCGSNLMYIVIFGQEDCICRFYMIVLVDLCPCSSVSSIFTIFTNILHRLFTV